MGFELENFGDAQLDADYVTYLVEEVHPDALERYERFWNYFRNPLLPLAALGGRMANTHSRPYFQAQEAGLPARITGVARGMGGGEQITDLRRKEVVIENDIAWRIETAIDFLFGHKPVIRCLADQPAVAAAVEAVLGALLEANGGVGFLQELALFGAVYGFVDIALRPPAESSQAQPQSPWRLSGQPVSALPAAAETGRPGTSPGSGFGYTAGAAPGPTASAVARAVAFAAGLQLEAVEAPRVLPILDENDYRRLRYWIQKYHKHPARMGEASRPWYSMGLIRRPAGPEIVEVVEIISPTWWQRYEDRRLAAEGPNPLGVVPIVHIQNTALPGSYEGSGEVEPLVALQDELNTRLSDRANRVTYQSFKMYLGKGIDDFLERPVGPGQMWATHNLDARIEEFGSDPGSPSEDSHIEGVRQALDKVSGVTPLAAGLIRGNVGNLTSATALKVVLGGLLARTAKKRQTYGAGLRRVFEMVLGWLDASGVLRTAPGDRCVEIHWPSPLPSDEGEQLRNAQIKAALGIPIERILAELGYQAPSSGSPQAASAERSAVSVVERLSVEAPQAADSDQQE
jgi:hypothetical protein